MANSRIPQRKKRKWQLQALDPPFPVPIATITNVPASEKNWYCFTGELEKGHVTVRHSGDIQYLYKMGFFGRGLMSQGAPDFYKRLPNVFIPQDYGDICPYKVARRRLFLRHNQWKKSHDHGLTNEEAADIDENKEYDSDVEYEPAYNNESMQPPFDPAYRDQRQGPDLAVVNELPMQGNDQGQDQGHKDTWTGSCETNHFWEQPISGTKQDDTDNERFEPVDQSKNMAPWDADKNMASWDTDKNKASWDTDNDGDADFWGSEDTGQPLQASTNSPEKHDLQQHSNDLPKDDHNILDIQGKSLPETSRTNLNVSEVDDCDMETHTESLAEKTADDKVTGTQSFNMAAVKVIGAESNVNEKDDYDTDHSHEELDRLKVKVDHKGDATNDVADTVSENNVMKANFDHGKQESPHLAMETESLDNFSDQNCPETTSGEATLPKLHPHCGSEDSDADYLVIQDSDSEEERGLRPMRQSDVVWKTVLKKDPFLIQEPLILSLEEAFFLSYGLGCLTVLGEKKVPLTVVDLWQRCYEVKVKFLPHYVAYHYFRSRGWVPKPGLLFGVDLILYKIGPPFYHGSYSVIVRTVHEGSLTEVEEYTDRKLTWTTFCGLHRVTEHVAKVLMICYVILPNSLTAEERKSPECINKFRVKLQMINRWISSQERGKEPRERWEPEEMP